MFGHRVLAKIGTTTLVVAFVLALVVAAILVLRCYGGDSFWPELVAGFAATVLAVVLALEFESRRDADALNRLSQDTAETRKAEARKRLGAVRREMEANQTSIGEVADGLAKSSVSGGTTWPILHPQLLDGAWSASGERLGDLLADYELVSDLSIFYGRVEELRWRLRYRTQARTADLDGMTFALADEMRGEVKGLLERVSAEEPTPQVLPLGIVRKRQLGGTIAPTGTLTLNKVTRETEDRDG